MQLKELRQNLKMSQKEAALLLEIPLRTYKRYETIDSYQKSYKYTWMCNIFINYLQTKKNQISSLKQESFNIVIAGCGYVGLSLACALSRENNVKITDINQQKIDLINSYKSPFFDRLIDKYLQGNHKIIGELSNCESYRCADFVIIATSTNFDNNKNCFDTSSIEDVIKLIRKVNTRAIIVIRSTVPLGYTNFIKKKNSDNKIIFSPEFLREGSALHDNLYPSRIVVGFDEKTKKAANDFALLLERATIKKDIPILLMKNEEAEAVKLFSNAFLAMRVAYFNELDSYAEVNGFQSQNIVKGISLDPRIGDFYNNPSFGYGGYCLPKDTAQLANSFLNIPNNNLIEAIVKSNSTRKQFIANQIINKAIDFTHKKKNELTIGIYLVAMKSNSDNYRSSSTIDVIEILKSQGIKIVIYDPNYQGSESDFDSFIACCDFYIANRFDKKLNIIKNKLYTRDIFKRD